MSNSETVGVILGGIAGGVIGNKFGKEVPTVLGAVVGAIVGSNIGRSFDETSRQRASAATHEALDTGDVGESVTWENPGNADSAATVAIEGREEPSCGTACRDDNGDWKPVSS